MRKCSRCKVSSDFGIDNSRKDGLKFYCKSCCKEVNSKWTNSKAGKKAIRNAQLKLNHKVTPELWSEMMLNQKGLCKLCNTRFDLEHGWNGMYPVVDHDHSCCPNEKSCGKCIRGLIHRKCNTALGMFNDNIDNLRLAVIYLENTNAKR